MVSLFKTQLYLVSPGSRSKDGHQGYDYIVFKSDPPHFLLYSECECVCVCVCTFVLDWGYTSSVWGDVSSNLGRSPKLCYTIVVHCREQTHTKRRHVLFPDWVARWTALSTQLQPWIANGTISGFHVGDELCWGGLPYSNMSAMATTIGNTEWQASHTFWCRASFSYFFWSPLDACSSASMSGCFF